MFVKNTISSFCGYWYLHAYVIMMMFASVINCAVDVGNRRKTVVALAPILILVFCWSFAGELRYLRDYIPHSNGLCQLSGYTLIGIYCAARIARIFESSLIFSVRRLLCMACFLGGIVAVFHVGFYDSPVAFLFALALFLLFKGIRIGHALRFVVPSLFSVYLIHTNTQGLRCMRYIDWLLYPEIGWISTFVTSAIIFIGGIILDIPRRLVVLIGGRMIKEKFHL